jgi:Major Facilitator Superfamily.
LLSLYLQHIKMLTPSQTGVVLIAEPVVQALFSPLAGRLSDRYEPRIISSIGMALNVVGLIPLIFIHNDTSIHYIVICLIILGIGFAFFSSPNVNATMSSVENKFYGIASATLGTMRLVGQMFSMGITMLVFAVIIGNHAISEVTSPLLLQSTQIVFIVLAVICAGGVFASLARGRVHKK